jgi:hypothetical protein
MTKLNKFREMFIGLLLFMLLGSASVNAQMRIGGSAAPNPSAILDLNPTDDSDNAIKGLALPRVELVATTDSTPLKAHVKGMYVYNTATVGDVTPGVYYNDGAKWCRVLASGSDSTAQKVKTLEIPLNELIKTQSKTFFGTTATASSAITIVGVEPQLSGSPEMLGTLLKVNTLAILNSSATAISWSVAIENDNINSTRSCTLEKVIISYLCNENLNGSLSAIYSIAGR